MPARLIVFAALSCFLPLLAAQMVKPASTPAAIAAKPDLAGEAMIVEKDDTVVRFAKDGSSVRTLSITEHILSDAGVRSSGIISIPFAALTQTMTFDSVRVRKP
jgi:hypothetical protein